VELCERAWLLEASAASSPAPYALLLLLEVELRRDLEDAGARARIFKKYVL
jgi:hypothetical protein